MWKTNNTTTEESPSRSYSGSIRQPSSSNLVTPYLSHLWPSNTVSVTPRVSATITQNRTNDRSTTVPFSQITLLGPIPSIEDIDMSSGSSVSQTTVGSKTSEMDSIGAFTVYYTQVYDITGSKTSFTTDVVMTQTISNNMPWPSTSKGTITTDISYYENYLKNLDTPKQTGNSATSSKGTIAGSVIGGVVFLILCAIIITLIKRKRTRNQRSSVEEAILPERSKSSLYTANNPFRDEFNFQNRSFPPPPVPAPRKNISLNNRISYGSSSLQMSESSIDSSSAMSILRGNNDSTNNEGLLREII